MTPHRRALALCLFSLSLTTATPAVADGRRTSTADYLYMVRDNDSLATLATRYYGASWKQVYIIAYNGLTSNRLRAGQKLILPSTWSYTVRPGDSAATIAQAFLGDAALGKLLLRENDIAEAEAPVGAVLVMPIRLRYTVTAHDTPATIARRFYGSARKQSLIIAFNKIVPPPTPGQVLTIPIFDTHALNVKDRAKKEALLRLRRHKTSAANREKLVGAYAAYELGRFTDACPTFEKLIIERDLALGDRADSLRHLAYCAVAFEDLAAAEDYLRKWFELTPDPYLDPATTSPKILAIAEELKREAVAKD